MRAISRFCPTTRRRSALASRPKSGIRCERCPKRRCGHDSECLRVQHTRQMVNIVAGLLSVRLNQRNCYVISLSGPELHLHQIVDSVEKVEAYDENRDCERHPHNREKGFPRSSFQVSQNHASRNGYQPGNSQTFGNSFSELGRGFGAHRLCRRQCKTVRSDKSAPRHAANALIVMLQTINPGLAINFSSGNRKKF